MGVHYTPAAIAFLKSLRRHNDRDWFNARKEVYERELKEQTLALIDEVNHGFASFAPEHVRPAGKVMMRIYRDIRFSKNKDPYKTNIAAWWARQGLEKTSGGGFYFELNPETITIAAGVYMPQPDQTLAIRRMLVERHADYRKLLTARTLRTAGMTPFESLAMTRTPKGFAADNPADDLVRQRQWGVSSHREAAAALTPALGKTILAGFRAAAPLVALLNEPLGSRPKPMF